MYLVTTVPQNQLVLLLALFLYYLLLLLCNWTSTLTEPWCGTVNVSVFIFVTLVGVLRSSIRSIVLLLVH